MILVFRNISAYLLCLLIIAEILIGCDIRVDVKREISSSQTSDNMQYVLASIGMSIEQISLSEGCMSSVCNTESIPNLVREKAFVIADSIYRDAFGSDAVFTARDYIKSVTGLQCQNVKVKLFVIEYAFPLGISYYCVLAYDAINKKLTPRPQFVNAKWMEDHEMGFSETFRLLRNPIIDFTNVLGGVSSQIIIRERTHNGNLYNALVANYYHVEGVDIKLVLAVEEVSVFNKQSEVKYVLRNLQPLDRGRFQLNTFVSSDIDYRDGRLVGTSVFRFNDETVEVLEETVIDEEYLDKLVTCSGLSEDVFLSSGYHALY